MQHFCVMWSYKGGGLLHISLMTHTPSMWAGNRDFQLVHACVSWGESYSYVTWWHKHGFTVSQFWHLHFLCCVVVLRSGVCFICLRASFSLWMYIIHNMNNAQLLVLIFNIHSFIRPQTHQPFSCNQLCYLSCWSEHRILKQHCAVKSK